jgi:uncharacterized protein (TIGR03067 family)
MTKYVLTVLVVGLLLAAEDKTDDAERDLKLLQGQWRVVSVERDGRVDDLKDKKDMTLVIDKDVFSLREGGVVGIKGTCRLDPSRRPKAIDIKVTEGSGTGNEVAGIYKIDNDGMIWRVAYDDKEARPNEFTTKAGDKHILVTFKRDKP